MHSAKRLAGWKTAIPVPHDPIPASLEEFPDTKIEFPVFLIAGNYHFEASKALFFIYKSLRRVPENPQILLKLPAFLIISL